MEQTATSTAFPSLELVFFSAKEAIHKALFPKTRIWMDFLDVELRLDADPSVLLASGVGKVAPGLESLVIRALHFDQLVVTGAFLPAPRSLGNGHIARTSSMRGGAGQSREPRFARVAVKRPTRPQLTVHGPAGTRIEALNIEQVIPSGGR
jgi:hypothetical protein